MADELIITVSGLRGIVGKNLTPEVAAAYGRAFGEFLRGRSIAKSKRLAVCIGRDSRPSGEMLSASAAAGLVAAGIVVTDLGLVTTPSVGIMVRHLNCAGGVIITASHNPSEYNGVKLLLDNGMAPPPDTAGLIKNLFLSKKFTAPASPLGKITSNNQADEMHISKVLAIIDAKNIAAKQFTVVLDSINGAGGRPGINLLERLGCKVVALNREPTGLFAHPPEPTVDNLTGLCVTVKDNKADVGFAQDPDADRLAIVDETGRYIGEEYTLALAAKLIFSNKTGVAATNLSTSRMLDDIAKAAGGQVVRTPVGEANVAMACLENNCVVGGEGNGGVIDLRVGPVRDSLVAMAFVLQLMAQTGKSVSQLVGEIPAYYMTKQKFPADKNTVSVLINAAKRRFPNAKIDTSDGCRFDLPDAWIHVRASNTEPLVRVIAEAKDSQTAQKYIDAVINISKKSAE
ncbi:MAG: phosphoglucosamine mutase [Sedimentisphaerales bacterium]|nr:phosphoglucosamine mutase [Sedimentisphaerales bacterium]